jgi:mannose-6-phosphate isomerase-like protein (cupin superfamily)
LSIPQFLEENFVGRAPLKESVLGCTDDTITRLLQLRDSLAEHTHDKLDEILYVVAGEGLIQMGSRQVEVSAGWLSVVPRGVRHKMDRRGRNPLVMLSMLAGAPCTADASSVAGVRK